MNNIKKIGLLIIALLISVIFSSPAGGLYYKFFGPSTSFIDFTSLVGLPLSYIFFLTLILTAFGGTKKYWWIGILLIPAAAFEVYFDWGHIYFPITVGLIGWLIGLGIYKLLLHK
ncbi:MAG: hypothetical protein HY973_04530 [Candidatus Kerfeldbacteria bacterium]|nr:hypothetical protein [Candidatus Kerfeldbacteria bacterium]